jgi:hypothetical protein
LSYPTPEFGWKSADLWFLLQKSNTQFLEILQNPSQTTQKIEETANIFLFKRPERRNFESSSVGIATKVADFAERILFSRFDAIRSSAADARERRKSNGDLGYVQFETTQLEHSSKSNQASKQARRERKEEEE